MTARSQARRNRNARIKREKNKVKELARLKKMLGITDADQLMEEVKDTVQVVDKKKALTEEKLIKEEFIEEKIQQDRGDTIQVVNPETGKKHRYNTKTMKDQFGSYPVWYRAKKIKVKMNKRKVQHKSNFWTSAFLPM